MQWKETRFYGAGRAQEAYLHQEDRREAADGGATPVEFGAIWPRLTDQLIRAGLPEEELARIGADVETTLRAVILWNEGKKIPQYDGAQSRLHKIGRAHV